MTGPSSSPGNGILSEEDVTERMASPTARPSGWNPTNHWARFVGGSTSKARAVSASKGLWKEVALTVLCLCFLSLEIAKHDIAG